MSQTEDATALSLERAVLVTVGLGGMLIPLNSTMVAVAIPDIMRDLNASVAQSGWLVTAYLITMASVQPIAGKLGDRYGRRLFLLGGYAVFAIASFGAAISRSVVPLIACRAGQALAGSVIFPNGSALLRQIVPEHRRGARFGLLGSSIAFGAAVGPPLGGILVEIAGWPAIFWVNLPLCGLVLAIAWRTIPRGAYTHSGRRFDLLGSGLLAGVLATGAWLLTRMRDIPSGTVRLVGAGIIVGFAAFLWRELNYPDPVVQPRFFRRRAFAAATGGIALSNLTLYVLILAVPFLLENRDWPVFRIGLAVTSMSLGMVVLAPIGGRLSDRLGRRAPAVAGMTCVAIGGCILAVAGPDVDPAVLIAAMGACGIGLGLGSGALQTSAVETIEPEHAGMASAASSTSRYVGSIVGAAVLAGSVSRPSGFQTVFTMTAIAGIASVGLAWALPSRRPSEPAEAEDVTTV